ncbi:pentatricopeptide repeat-containing protein OTP51, chloroplastic-like [Dioscorea cayenensis subsp. rotundata]|uniref:Pentatricopeptide repeat-containing protein OTP51, chloroplastic-like n=1 Tax=Dioscorea cayennensis subsp. rotundata TaxID=55577 RepID=A0AB40B5Q3_DIOCR|nr:pentatricopeptide repeat-containing protein OTP51, chloroplastic-like [Dioscorea cayenensis subsp. rotundata]
MVQQHWFHFDFALATKLADHLGKDRKFAKCREMFDAIISHGRVPSESTFHILTVAYLSAPVQGCLDEVCTIYNRMIQLGGYRPRLSLHNSLFRALVSKPGGLSKHYLKQAEFIYHQLVTLELEVHKDIYAGLIWLHSYQDNIDRERITALREEMQCAGIEESRDVLISLMRAFSKEGDVDETERAWLKLIDSGGIAPFQAFVYRIELYAKIGEPMKSLKIFKGMKEKGISINVAVYNKIIEVMSEVPEVEIVEELVDELINSGMKPLTSAFLDLLKMYLNLGVHDKLEVSFANCLERCRPNRSIYYIYLKSLVGNGNLEKAEEIFYEMHTNPAIGIHAQSCNTILGAYLSSGDFVKAEKIYDLMCQKKYDIEPQYMEKLDYILSLKRKVIKRPVSMKLDPEQREILMGLLIGGLRIQSDEEWRNHAIYFEFNGNSNVHSLLKIHIHERFYEWLKSSNESANRDNDIPDRFSTIAHSYFGFFADQFWLKGRPVIPKLIHRWLSPRVLAYWYMYGGFRTSSGDILLKLKGGNQEDLKRIAKVFQAKSLTCKVKRKGRVFWIGFQGDNAVWFWKLTEPYILENVREFLTPESDSMRNEPKGDLFTDFDSESDNDELPSL